ncbi:MAG: hypothetical protein N2Z79_03390 [Candidatus Omnitrophica bacterium]|nr:hypothetical protein [Candidatus Omnitrophota bacterium]
MRQKDILSPEVQSLQKEFLAIKHSKGNFRCRKCLIVDGYEEEEKNCRWCGALLFEIDKL